MYHNLKFTLVNPEENEKIFTEYFSKLLDKDQTEKVAENDYIFDPLNSMGIKFVVTISFFDSDG